MTSRSKRAAIAAETISIIESGSYMNAAGSTIEFADDIAASIEGTRTFAPEDFDAVELQVAKKLQSTSCDTEFCVANETTFAAASNILQGQPQAKILCLNFASAKNAGGGFIGGSQAQEEALCRASALYACIEPQRTYYDTNRRCGTCLYTDYMIYSPMVPVFRDDNDDLLIEPYRVSFITAPAVNAGALANSEPEKLPMVADVMRSRIEKLLSLAVLNGYRHLVLGAWGCGVFRNEPSEIAELFREQLTGSGRFAAAFECVRFGVLDFTKDESTFRGFDDCFQSIVS